MSTDELFRQLDPPPGGAERFARRLDELIASSPTPRRRVPALAAAACVVLVLVAAVALLRPPDDSPPQLVADSPPVIDVYGAPEFDRLLGRTRPPAELTVVVGAETAAVTQLETGNEKVRIYRIN